MTIEQEGARGNVRAAGYVIRKPSGKGKRLKKEIIIVRKDECYTDLELSAIVNECCRNLAKNIDNKENYLIVPLEGGTEHVFDQVRQFTKIHRLKKTEIERRGKTAAIGIEPAEPEKIDGLAARYHLYIFAWDKQAG